MRFHCFVYIVGIALTLSGATKTFGASEDYLGAIMRFSLMYDANQLIINGTPEAMAGWVDTTGKGIPIIVYNPSSWTRTDYVDAQSPFPGLNSIVILTDDKGKKVIGQSQGDRLYFTAFDVPSMGYKLYFARRSKLAAKNAVTGKGPTIENQFLSVKVHQNDGTLIQMLDKRYKRALLQPDTAGAVPQIVNSSQTESLIGNTEVVLMESGPARARITFDHYYSKSQINEDIVLYDSIPRMDLVLTIDWQEPHKTEDPVSTLRFAFPIPVKLLQYRRGYPPGYTIDKTDPNKKEVQQWIDLSAVDWGLTVCSSIPIIFEVSNGTLYAILPGESLLPTGTDAEDATELTLSFYPRQGKLGVDKFTRLAMQSSNPLQAIEAKQHVGILAKSHSFLSLTNPGTVVVKAKYDDFNRTLAVTIRNVGAKSANTTMLTSCKYNSWSIDNKARTPRPIKGGINISLEALTEKTIILYR